MNLPIWIPSKVTELVSAIFVSKARRRAHNAAAPVNQLPPEILAQIFEFASAEVRDTSMDWIALTHTCQYWRNAALGHPRLWSRFSFLNPGFAQAMLERSGDTPITVALLQDFDISWMIRRSPDLPHLPIDRIEYISFRHWLGRDVLRELLWDSDDQPFPILETIEVGGSCVLPAHVDWLCQKLASGGAPVLRHLKFRDVCVSNWDVLQLGASLKSLHLWWWQNPYDDSPPDQGPSLTELLGHLQAMPLLEELAISYLNPGTTNLPVASLRNLKTIISMDVMHTQTLLLGALHIPNIQKIDLNCLDVVQNTVQLGQLLASIRKAWEGQSSASVFRKLKSRGSNGFNRLGNWEMWHVFDVYDNAAGWLRLRFRSTGVLFPEIERTFLNLSTCIMR
ncbi:hypothetical protein DFP72DRAFT_1114283 [Ephemerocybe angulata]|uniref:F-box domain-containing protein n=1 Tax=Ephemerocybe angulata TaxID=980116 RepID=A0A8H6I3L2_9AGAR|nr:hypothetical protein DFP72DRAFT_1114283 [Tulosesus angulatus]